MGSRKGFLVVLTVCSVFLLSLGMAAAQEPGQAEVDSETDLGEYLFEVAADNVDLDAGNVTEVALDSNVSTIRWAGLVGNVSGNIVLGDSNENVLYEWVSSGLMVYASELSSPDWSNLADANTAAVTTDYAHLANANEVDNYTETFNNAAEDIGSLIFNLTSDYAWTYDDTETQTWKTYSLTDGTGGTDIVFAGRVSEDGTDFRGNTVDFQMIVPEDGTALSGAGATNYNLWVELV